MLLPTARPRWPAVVTELALVLAGVGVYFGVRGITATDVDRAQANAADVVALQDRLGLGHEARLQDMVDNSAPLMTILNWIYIWGHWPVIGAVLLWLFLRHPGGYLLVRTTMLLSGAVGLVVFAAYPLAPPRLAGLGLVDTVSQYSTSYRLLQPPALVNQYAAMPSLHVGWDLLMGIALATYAAHRVLRVVGAVLPVAMVAAVVLTANHYILDAVAGAGLVLVSLAVARRIGAPRGWTTPPPPEVAVPATPVTLPGQRGASSLR